MSQNKANPNDLAELQRHREYVFAELAKEAAGFYNMVVSVASAFLGGTLLYLREIAPSPSLASMFFLLAGWACLVAAIVLICLTRWGNIKSARRYLEGNITASQRTDALTEKSHNWAIALLVGGLALLLVFGAMNLLHDMKKERTMSDKDVKDQHSNTAPAEKRTIRAVIQESIPFSALKPDTPGIPPGPAQARPQNSETGGQPNAGAPTATVPPANPPASDKK